MVLVLSPGLTQDTGETSDTCYMTLINIITRMRVNFHKGYPHGSAALEMITDDETDSSDKVWSGQFWNGVVVDDDNVDDTIR